MKIKDLQHGKRVYDGRGREYVVISTNVLIKSAYEDDTNGVAYVDPNNKKYSMYVMPHMSFLKKFRCQR